jgi:predicted aspartyl protease
MNMRALKAALLALLLSLISLRASQAPAQTNAAAVKPTVVEVPMLFRGPTPAVEVMVNGQGPFIFAIDTGAQGMARIDSSLAERLKLKPVGQVQAGDGSGRNTRRMDVFELDSLTLGSVQLKAVRAPSRDYNVSTNLPRIDGIIGFNLFSDYLLTLDFPAKRVRLERGQLPKPDGAEILSFDNSRGIPIVELSVGSYKVKAHIDSGNTMGGFVLPTALAEKLKFTGAPVTLGRASTVTSDVEIKQARLQDSIRLGRFEFAEPTIIFPAVADYANIGAKVLREFSLTFDQKNKSIRLKRQEASKAAEQQTAAVPQEFKDYSGKYGERTVTVEDGALFLQRQGGPRLKLASVARDEFALEIVPEARIKFIRGEDGKVLAINVLNRTGQWEKAVKDQP